jgi:hypothetical protein
MILRKRDATCESFPDDVHKFCSKKRSKSGVLKELPKIPHLTEVHDGTYSCP